MPVEGHFSNGRQARADAALLRLEAGRLRVESVDGRALIEPERAGEVKVSARLGRTPRHVTFRDGSCFSTDDNDGIDAMLGLRSRSGQGLVDRLESHWRFVAASVVATVAAVLIGVFWGVPAAARHVAFQLPASVGQEAERVAFEMLDRGAFEASRLDRAEQARLQALFAPVIERHAADLGIRVHFRDASKSFGANALALPGGSVVMTDQLVELARHDEELIAILAHEIGHIAERHALRRTVQTSALSLFALLVFGDVSSVPALAASIPVILTEMGYSRDFEREADLFAIRALHDSGIPPQRLGDILSRLDPEHSGSSYLSTHPPTPERIEMIGRHARP
ncbi:MAG: M48 family metallopeptidase [Zoogloeaceae bacterium]|nr:M48 family metallopeptidase [Zoogloeaceae bacterium]